MRNVHPGRIAIICLLLFALSAAASPGAGADIRFRGARQFALIVAGWYEDGSPHKEWYWKVTESFHDVLTDRYGFWDHNIHFLVHQDKHNDPRVDGFSTVDEIEDAVNDIVAKAQKDDVVVFFFVGHGGAADANSCHFAASDTGLVNTTLAQWAAPIKSEHQLWTFSQCHSGPFAKAGAKAGRTVFTSCNWDEGNAMPWAEAVRDAFNYANGADANQDGLISFVEAYNFARRRQVSHYGGENKLKEHGRFSDCAAGTPPVTGFMPSGNQGQHAQTEILGSEFGPMQTWAGKANDGQKFTYEYPFGGKAVVVCSAHQNGKPVAACAVDNTDRGFTLALRSPNGQPARNADAMWVAYLPNPNSYVQAGCQYINKGHQKISFPKKFNWLPIVVCNAQYRGEALCAGVDRFSRDSFDVWVADNRGARKDGAWLLWIAAHPGIQRPNYRCSGGHIANYPIPGARTIPDAHGANAEVRLASAAWEDGARKAMIVGASGNNLQINVTYANGNPCPSWLGHYLTFRANPKLRLATTIRRPATIRIAP